MKTIHFATLAAAALLVTAAPGQAEHTYKGKMNRVKILAHQLEDAAKSLHYSAQKSSHHPGSYERKALTSIYNLASRAEHFHREVERYYRDPYHTEDDLRALVRVFGDVQDRFAYLHANRYVYDDLRCVEDVMIELGYLYGYELRPYRDRHRYRRRGYSDDRGYGRDRSYRRAYPRRGYRYP